ncbi:hypothetical protein GE09DRAFT_1130114 [Coniochaeta sp. 2T2.1]|nr:hypothetical protein GE09DRAFT_1130114 [Coniochaeta sp. 2T2.1]
MPTTRAKAHSASNGGDDAATAGTKHELADKKDQKTTKKQKTLEETVENGNDKSSAKEEKDDQPKAKRTKTDDGAKTKTTPKKSKAEAKVEEKDDEHEVGANGKKDDSATKTNDKSEAKSTSKSDDKPSGTSLSSTTTTSPSILEKGTIYFFLRGRVNNPSPSSITEIARTYILLRPNTTASKARLLAVPKKTLPTTGRERWISFVEKTSLSLSDLQSSFLEGNEYETKTRGTQHTPAARPEGEGVYAIISKPGGRESHLVYLLTRPKELGEVHVKLGLKERGSWVVTTRNPEYPPPGGAGRLPEGPEFPEEVKKDFHSLRWAPTKPDHLDVEGAQVLLVGESSGIEKATEPQGKGEEEDPKEELEELAEEDEKRMESLGEDDSEAIFKDLRADADALPEMQSEFGE